MTDFCTSKTLNFNVPYIPFRSFTCLKYKMSTLPAGRNTATLFLRGDYMLYTKRTRTNTRCVFLNNI